MKRPHAARMMWWSVVPALAAAPWPLHAEEGATFAALQAAYSMEVNAETRYLAFANRAESDAQPLIACYFRAAARAESVHASNHSIVIEQLQGKPTCVPREFVVRGTAENLVTSIETELWERSAVYPRFADYARAECLYEALASCNYARGAEATHETLFRAALSRLVQDVPADGGLIPLSFSSVAPTVRLASFTPVTPPILQEWGTRCFLCLGDGSLFAKPLKRCPNCNTGGSRLVEQRCKW